MAGAKEKLPPPEGTRAMMISMREMETLGLKTGSGLRETVPYKLFNKQEILDQIAQIGFMCPFHEYRSEIVKLQGDEILIVADPNEVYGENWLLCLTRKALEAQLEVVQRREQERLDALAAQERSTSEGDADDELAQVVYEDTPVVAQPWVSSTAQETHEDVQSLTIRGNRALLQLSVTKMSDEFNADYKFSDRDAEQCFVEWRQHKDPNYELTRLEQDVALQGIPELVDNTTQTSWFRSVNSALQYEPMGISEHARQAAMDSDRMHTFLAKMLPLVEQALQQNETLDIFLDPFANLHEEDNTLASKMNENAIKELRSFTDLIYSKNKTLPSVDWHPKKNGVVAVAAAANVSFAKRLDLLDKIDSSFILIWNFVDLIHPQLMLEAPQDVLTVRFNPTQPHIVAAGLYNGQVLVWDFSRAEHLLSKLKANKNNNAATKGGRRGSDPAAGDALKPVAPVKPLYTSYIDTSHRRCVAELHWLPAGMEVNNRGHLVATGDATIHQFVTIAADGQVAFWDLRFKDPKYRGLTRTKAEKNATAVAAAAAKDAPPEVHFTPIYAITLNKVDATGELALRSFCFEKPKDDGAVSSRFYCGTEEGELVYADWRPHASTSTSSSKTTREDDSSAGGGADDGGGGVEYVQWLAADHFRPTITLRTSPFFPAILLTVSESHFHLWNVAQQSKGAAHAPIFVSPLSLAAITCATFSPTRPGVVYIGKADGVLEVWDFMDQSHRSSLSIGVTACALTSIEFRPQITTTTTTGGQGVSASTSTGASGKPGVANSSKQPTATGAVATGSSIQSTGNNLTIKQQLIAIGDQLGNLHILEIPRTLARATSGERSAMEGYFKRESERMQAARASQRPQSHQSGASARGGGGFSGREDAVLTQSSPSPSLSSSASKENNASATGDEDVFKRMETEFCKELGLETLGA